MNAAAVFREAREERGLSQEQVSLALGVPRTHITTIENDELRAKLVRFYGIAKPQESEQQKRLRLAVQEAIVALPAACAASEILSRAKARESIARRAAHISTIAFNLVVGGFFAMIGGGAIWVLTGGAL